MPRHTSMPRTRERVRLSTCRHSRSSVERSWRAPWGLLWSGQACTSVSCSMTGTALRRVDRSRRSSLSDKMSSKMLTILRAEPLDDYWVRLVLNDGSTIERNVLDLLRGPVFEPVRADYGRFRRLRVRGGTVEWPGRLDLDTDVLIWNGPAPRERGVRPELRVVLRHPTARYQRRRRAIGRRQHPALPIEHWVRHEAEDSDQHHESRRQAIEPTLGQCPPG